MLYLGYLSSYRKFGQITIQHDSRTADFVNFIPYDLNIHPLFG